MTSTRRNGVTTAASARTTSETQLPKQTLAALSLSGSRAFDSVTPPTEKRCPRCRWTLPLERFAVDPTKSGGRKSWCLHCDRERSREYYRKNAAAVVARQLAARAAKRFNDQEVSE